MALTDTGIRSLKPRDKAFKVSDERGLYLQVTPTGGKLWRLKYRINDMEKKLALGAYPDVSLAGARKARDDARALLAEGGDPAAKKQRDKVVAKLQAQNTFSGVAEDYIADKLEAGSKAAATINKAQWLLKQLAPTLGKRPIAEIEPHELLAILRRIEASGRNETAIRCLSFASRVFRYGVATTRCKTDPAALLKGALITPTVKHHAAILEPKAVGKLLRAIDDYEGSGVTLRALQIAPHVFVRPGELRQAQWDEFDLAESVWRIPPGRMKSRKPHVVPLSQQVIAHLKALSEFSGPHGYVFPSIRSAARPMSSNTLNAAFRRMGYASDELTAHGLRSTASTLLNESGKWSPDAIERALAHKDSDNVRAVYHRGQHWNERVEMAQWWSDYLDTLKVGGEVVDISVYQDGAKDFAR